MPLVHVSTAAQLTRRNRSTIVRAIKKGRISAQLDVNGWYLIDPAELERAFGRLAPKHARASMRTGVVHNYASMHRGAGRDIEETPGPALGQEVVILREQLERERSERERERYSFDEERRFLRGLIESHTEQIRLLTQPPESKALRRRWWFW